LKKKIKKIFEVLRKPYKILLYLDAKGIMVLPDVIFLKYMFMKKLDKKINFDNPKTFNEKMQWLKLYDRKDIYTNMADKIEAKKYVSNIIGEEYVIPTLGIYQKFDEIDFEKLPEQFVIKCNHYGGNNGIILCKQKKDFKNEKSKKIINKLLKKNLFYYGREWPYKNIKPKILVEELLYNDGKDIIDYKFWCFNGKPKLCLVCTDRNSNLKETFFDMEWNSLDLKRPTHDIDKKITKPINFELMKELSCKLSEKIPFIRVDFYEVSGKVYFGELTFYPASGFAKFEPEEWDNKLGDWLKLPK